MKLGKLLTHVLPPAPVLLPSFAAASAPDHVIEVAGLRIGAHSEGLPHGAINYLTISREPGRAPVSPVPEPSSLWMAMCAALVLLAVRRHRHS